MQEDYIEGRNPVAEAVRAERDIEKIYVQKGAMGSIHKIIAKAKSAGIPIVEVEKVKLDALSDGGSHQGIIAAVSAAKYSDVDTILKSAEDKGEPAFIIIAEGLTDPHNLGAIIRTANGAGVHGIIIPKRRSVGINATVAKTSAGAVEYTPVAKVPNIAACIELLKQRGLWVIGMEGTGEKSIFEADLSGPVAIVVGSEGEGMSRLVRERCDMLIKIPMKGDISSLNASVACGVVMYEVLRRRIIKG